jgi:hypothetical protein
LAVQGVKQQKFNTRDILQRNKIVPKMASKMPVVVLPKRIVQVKSQLNTWLVSRSVVKLHLLSDEKR